MWLSPRKNQEVNISGSSHKIPSYWSRPSPWSHLLPTSYCVSPPFPWKRLAISTLAQSLLSECAGVGKTVWTPLTWLLAPPSPARTALWTRCPPYPGVTKPVLFVGSFLTLAKKSFPAQLLMEALFIQNLVQPIFTLTWAMTLLTQLLSMKPPLCIFLSSNSKVSWPHPSSLTTLQLSLLQYPPAQAYFNPCLPTAASLPQQSPPHQCYLFPISGPGCSCSTHTSSNNWSIDGSEPCQSFRFHGFWYARRQQARQNNVGWWNGFM